MFFFLIIKILQVYIIERNLFLYKILNFKKLHGKIIVIFILISMD